MQITSLSLQDAFCLEPKIFSDARGYFFESYNQARFAQATGQNPVFVQDNQSFSQKGTLRGLHFQQGEYAQAKLIRVLQGEILDVIVDLRADSPTYRQWEGVRLSAENKKQLFVPRGFAHGFVVLSEQAEVFYKCDNFYAPEYEAGLIYNDATLQIDWQLEESELILSEKDKAWPSLQQIQGLPL